MSNSITQAFKALQVSKAETLSQHDNVYEVSYEYLSKIKNFNDVKAFQNCLVALINLDKYNKAYELVRKIPNDSVEAELVLEIAYVLYKVGKSDELLQLVNKHQDAASGYYLFGIKNVLAQNYYKIGKYKESLQLFQECIQESGNANVDFAVNERAVISQINFQQVNASSSASTVIDKEGELNYDLLFNESLVEFSKDNKDNALKLLQRAEELCLEQNMGVDNEVLLSELLPIRLNIAFIKQAKGDYASAIADLSGEMKNIDSITDELLRLILKLNLYSCKQQQAGGTLEESNLVFRDLQLQEVLNKMNQKLTKFQYHVLMKNNLVGKYLDGTLGATVTSSKFISRYLESFPGDLTPLAYSILSELQVTPNDLKEKEKRKLILKKLHVAGKQAENENKKFALAILSDYVLKSLDSSNESGSSAFASLYKRVLDDLENDKLQPSVVSSFMTASGGDATYKKGKEDFVQKLKEKILSTGQETLVSDHSQFLLYKEVGYLALQDQSENIAEHGKHILQALAQVAPNDASLVAYVSNDVSQLENIEELQATETVDELIQAYIAENDKSGRSVKPQSRVHKTTVRKRTPKFSSSKTIKPEDELNLDPERWLPMKVRSYYKPSKKDKKVSSHQGATERLSTPQASSPAPVPASTSAKSSSNNKSKKKKKGKK